MAGTTVSSVWTDTTTISAQKLLHCWDGCYYCGVGQILLLWCLDGYCCNSGWTDTITVVSAQILLQWCQDEYYYSGVRTNTTTVVSFRGGYFYSGVMPGYYYSGVMPGYYFSGVMLDTATMVSGQRLLQ